MSHPLFKLDALQHFALNLTQSVTRHILMISLLLCATVVAGVACTERTMLDYIGSLEAPRGYDQVYYGVRTSPPRPITSMTVQEVLDWQRIASRTAVSSAAGRYQVIRSTLKSIVDKGVVSKSDVYNAATQDRIGLHLLRGTGYRSGVTSPVVANRVAGIWAALPKVSGPGRGASVYEGYAGNHALTDADTYMGVMDCTITLAEAKLKTAVIRAGTRFGFNFNRIVETIAEQSKVITEATSKYALALLFLLALIDLVLHFGRAAIEGTPWGQLEEAFLYKILTIAFFYVFITYLGDIIILLGDFAVSLGEDAVGKTGFSLAGYAREKTILIFSLFEGLSAQPTTVGMVVVIIVVIIIVTTGLTMGVIVYSYSKLFIVAAAGVIVLSFGGLSSLQRDAKNYIFRLLGAALHICTMIIILYIGLVFAQTMRGDYGATISALIILVVEIIVLFLIVMQGYAVHTRAY